MPSSNSIKAEFIPMQSAAFGAIGGAYAAVGNSTTLPGRLFIIKNNTDQQLIFSFDGVHDHFTLNSMENLIVDGCANSATTVVGFYLDVGTTLFVKDNGVAPASGSVYFSVMVGVDGY